jgi:hypothetical protein
MIAAVCTILGAVGVLALMAWYLYRMGVTTERRANELATLQEKERIENAARKAWDELDDECADKRAAARNFLHNYLQDGKVSPTPKPLPGQAGPVKGHG